MDSSLGWRRLRRYGPLLAVVAVLLVSVVLSVRASIAAADGRLIYALDDAYIHLAIAKNVARHGVWGCTPFHFSSSSSSPLWTLLLALIDVAVGVRDATPLALNTLLALLTLVVADRYLTRFSVSAVVRLAALFGLVIASALPAMILIGMEHVLHLLLTIWFTCAAADALARTRGDVPEFRSTILLCGLAALLGASRYEGFFLIAIVCLTFAFLHQLWRGVLIGATACAPAVAFGAISVMNGAFFFPNSLMLKAASGSASGLAVLLKPIGSEDLAFLQHNLPLLAVAVVSLVGAAVHAIKRRGMSRPHVLLPLWLPPAILLHGHLVFSSTYWAYRYDAYLLGLAVFAASVALSDFGSGTGTRAQLWNTTCAVVLVTLVGNVANYKEAIFPRAEIAGSRNTLLEHVAAAEFVRAYYSHDVVAVNDLGAVTYYTEARILDIAGLGDVEPLIVQRRTGSYERDDVRTWTGAYQPRIAIIQLDWAWVAPRIPREWIKTAEVAIPPGGQRLGLYAIDPGAAAALRANVAYHYGELHGAAGYRVRLF